MSQLQKAPGTWSALTWSARRFLRRLARSTASAAVPAGQLIYAVGDIHGRSDLLDSLLTRIQADASGRAATLIFLGDYVDHGPDSQGVIDRLIKLEASGQVYCLCGNHDEALLRFVREPLTFRSWRTFGAIETLLSYGVRPPLADSDEAILNVGARFQEALPASHRGFFERLRLTYESGDYFFTHAGVRPGVALDSQADADLLWIREEFLRSNADFGKVIVHGHTPTRCPVQKANRIGIDTGAYKSGILTAAVLEGRSCRFLTTQ